MLTAYELASGHRREQHLADCQRPSCIVCHLFVCAICGGMEGSLLPLPLLPICPGRQLSVEEHAQNYRDYCAHTGAFAPV